MGKNVGGSIKFKSTDDFRDAFMQQTSDDVKEIETKLGRSLTDPEKSRIGVMQLRHFLEQLLLRMYATLLGKMTLFRLSALLPSV